MKKFSILTIPVSALLMTVTAFADETTAAQEKAVPEEAARVSAINGNWIMWALIIGFLIALLVTAVWKAQLRTVYSKWEAYDYVRKDSLNLVSRNERFLYRNIQKVPIPKEQNHQGGHGGPGVITFGGSAGGHGGSGGIMFGGGAGGQGGHGGGITLGGHVRPGSNSGGLNYGGHIEPGAKPGAGGSAGRPGGLFGRGGASGGNGGSQGGHGNRPQGRGPHSPE